ncbi:MAG TPA: nucleotide sugar dehydrogenase [Myxococcales bacterium]|nr:nucleotide sugar dehydrogenase [Myxococcales bacterium]
MSDERFDKVAIIGGCGHVGLPLGILLATDGRQVSLVDINRSVVDLVNRGKLPFVERGGEQLLGKALAAGKLRATTESAAVAEAAAVVMVTGTPVDEHLNPNVGMLDRIIDGYAGHLKAGQLLILRSTVYPGTTQRVAARLAERGLALDVAFCPERIAQGFALEESARLPQIVSGVTPRAAERARAFFQGLVNKILQLEPMEAELAKLFTNTWRYLSFAASNQFYTLANDFGLDFHHIYDAMVADYPRMAGFARPGFAAGPCLFKDTMQLAAFSNNSFFLGHAAMLVNEGLPNYLVGRLKLRYRLKESTVGILGMAFKADNDDPRESLSYKLRKVLSWEAKGVLCSDPFIADPSFVSAEELVRRSDIVMLGTPHAAYRSLDLGDKPFVDVWNLWGKGARV